MRRISTWGRVGSVYSPKRKHYVRLGSTESVKVIANELARDAEWYRRVTFMAQKGGAFAEKLRALL